MLIDTHAHMNDERYNEDRTEIIKNFNNDNIEKIITVSYDFVSSKHNLKLAQENKNIYFAVGFHPHNADDYSEEFEAFATAIAPITPPAGPERIEFIPLKFFSSERPPFDCIYLRSILFFLIISFSFSFLTSSLITGSTYAFMIELLVRLIYLIV